MKLAVFTICLNEEETIGELLDRIPKKIDGISEIKKYVYSDGSTDRTVEIARNRGAEVIENRDQKRLAFSFQKAIQFMLSTGADIAVNIDGDLQFNPEDIPKLVKPIVENKADFVAADRFTDKKTGKMRKPKNMPPGKYYGNILGAKIVSGLSGKTFKDVTCGFRAYNREAMLSLNINSKYTYTQESFQVLAVKKLDVATVPVEVKYFPMRKSRVVTSFYKFLVGSAVNIMRAFRDYAPLKFFTILGMVPFILGIAFLILLGIYWLTHGTFTPYKFAGYLGAYLSTIGIVIWLIGVLADILDRVLNNQEKILYELKKINYSKKEDPKSR